MTGQEKRIPIVLLTGFLGAGKTTWLSRALRAESTGRVAVLVNEFGEVGIDHLLVGEIAPDTVLLKSGCICCQIRGELKQAVLTLMSRAQCGEIPEFDRIVIETTGLADPSQILSTLNFDPVLHNQVYLQEVVSIADAKNHALHGQQPEWSAQIAAASVILLSKTEMVSAQRQDALRLRLGLLNPTARIESTATSWKFEDVLTSKHEAQPHAQPRFSKGGAIPARAGFAHHDGTGAQTLVMSFAQPLDWTQFVVWLSALIHCHGAKILRVKCLLKTVENTAVLIDGVGHTLHHPRHLDTAQLADEASHLVFIARGLDMAQLRASFEAFFDVNPA